VSAVKYHYHRNSFQKFVYGDRVVTHFSESISPLVEQRENRINICAPKTQSAALKKRGSRWESPSSSLMRATRRRLKIYMQSKTNKYIHALPLRRENIYAVPPRAECYRAPQFPINIATSCTWWWLKAFISVCNIFIMRERVCVWCRGSRNAQGSEKWARILPN
jgi:hypothetical protein